MARAARPAAAPSLPLATIALVLATPALTRLRPQRLCRILTLVASRGGDRDPRAALARVERALSLGARVQRQTCLTRGVSRFVVLRRAGLPVELVFGLGPHGGSYAGHCWLELDGTPYLEPDDPRGAFPEILRVPAAARA